MGFSKGTFNFEITDMRPYGAGLDLYFDSKETKRKRLKNLFDFIKKQRPNESIDRVEKKSYNNQLLFLVKDLGDKKNYREHWYHFDLSGIYDEFVTTVFLDVDSPHKFNYCCASQRKFIAKLIQNGLVDSVDYWYGEKRPIKYFFQKKYRIPTIEGYDFAVYLYFYRNKKITIANRDKITADIQSLLKEYFSELKFQSKIVTYKKNDCSILKTLNSNFLNKLENINRIGR